MKSLSKIKVISFNLYESIIFYCFNQAKKASTVDVWYPVALSQFVLSTMTNIKRRSFYWRNYVILTLLNLVSKMVSCGKFFSFAAVYLMKLEKRVFYSFE